MAVHRGLLDTDWACRPTLRSRSTDRGTVDAECAGGVDEEEEDDGGDDRHGDG